VTDRQTDRQTTRPRNSVCNNSPHLARAAIVLNNNSYLNTDRSLFRNSASLLYILFLDYVARGSGCEIL